jgi:predicted nucleic acid-binding Zn ribbon protein
MRKVRELAKKKRRCRVCGKPVVKSERTGRPSSACKKHLVEDRARKTPTELAWEADVGRPIDIRIDERGTFALLDGQYRYLLTWRR